MKGAGGPSLYHEPRAAGEFAAGYPPTPAPSMATPPPKASPSPLARQLSFAETVNSSKSRPDSDVVLNWQDAQTPPEQKSFVLSPSPSSDGFPETQLDTQPKAEQSQLPPKQPHAPPNAHHTGEAGSSPAQAPTENKLASNAEAMKQLSSPTPAEAIKQTMQAAAPQQESTSPASAPAGSKEPPPANTTPPPAAANDPSQQSGTKTANNNQLASGNAPLESIYDKGCYWQPLAGT